MLKKVCFISFFISLFLSCKTVPNSSLYINKSVDISSEGLLNIFFPTFEDFEGNVIGGDGIVIIFPDNSNMIIDGFYPEASEKYIQYIKNLGIEKIDNLVVTHFHADHIGTFCDLLEHFEVENIYTNGGHINTPISNDFVEKIKNNETILKEGTVLKIGDCRIDVFSPNLSSEDFIKLYNNPGKTAEFINNSSLVFKLKYKDFSILFTGDVYKKQDKKLCEKYKNELQSTIVKVPHHGEFYTASSKKFISTINADYGVVCDDRYFGQIINTRYKKAGTKLLNRNSEGQIKITTDGKDIVWSL